MNKAIVVKTERLTIYSLSDFEMEELIDNEINTDMKQAYSEMLGLYFHLYLFLHYVGQYLAFL